MFYIMKNHNQIYIFNRFRIWLFCLCGLATSNSAFAIFVPFSSELDWQTAVGSSVMDTFESYSVGEQFSSLPALGVSFDELAGGGFPVIYQHDVNTTPYGTKHLANFPNGTNAINQFDDIILRPLAGLALDGLGFWNGDGQADTLIAYVYNASDTLLGSVGAVKGNFAGFTSTEPVAYVRFDGNTGDGWNHLDGLQTSVSNSSAVPEPTTIALIGLGFMVLRFRRVKA